MAKNNRKSLVRSLVLGWQKGRSKQKKAEKHVEKLEKDKQKFDARSEKLAKKYGVGAMKLDKKEAYRAILRAPMKFIQGGVRTVLDQEEPYTHHKRYAEMMDLSLGAYLQKYYQKDFLRNVKWMGVEARKQITDLWVYQEVIHEVKPDYIIEIGSFQGGTTLYMAHLMDIIGHGKVIAIDIDHSKFEPTHERIIKITGDCSDPKVVQEVEKLVAGKKTLVIHDGDHTKDAVLRDLKLYAPMVSPDSYLIVEDGIVDVVNPKRIRISDLQDGPLKAVETFLENDENKEFEISEKCERFLLTSNPRGYLHRVAPEVNQ